jgi:hypothetical protein
MTPDLMLGVASHYTVTPTICEVDHETNREPDDKPDPILIR